jgi:hypothetical protein
MTIPPAAATVDGERRRRDPALVIPSYNQRVQSGAPAASTKSEEEFDSFSMIEPQVKLIESARLMKSLPITYRIVSYL